MLAVTSEAGSTFRAEPPRVLFRAPYSRVVWLDANFDVSLDGRRFLMVREDEPAGSTGHINLIQHWTEELRRLVPVN
jgi:hypothetical protein